MSERTHSLPAFSAKGSVPAETTARRRIIGLDLVRASAIIGVMLAHTTLKVWDQQRWPDTVFFKVLGAFFMEFGGWGVDAFFALSGYLIGGIIYRDFIRGAFPVASFWQRRWLRTLPAYFFFLATNVALGCVFSPHHLWLDWRYLVYLQNFLAPHPPFFREAWSLSVEEWFYVITPLLLIGLARVLRPALAFGGVVALLIGGSLLYRIIHVVGTDPSWDEGVRKIVLLRLDALGTGVGVAFLEQQGIFSTRAARWMGLLLGLVCLALSLVIMWPQFFDPCFMDHSFLGRILHPLISPLGCALLLPAFARLQVLPGRGLSAGVRWIALISYSMYLCHLSVYGMVERFGHRFDWPVGIFITFSWVASLGVATLSYWFVERPFIAFYRKRTIAEPGAGSRDLGVRGSPAA